FGREAADQLRAGGEVLAQTEEHGPAGLQVEAHPDRSAELRAVAVDQGVDAVARNRAADFFDAPGIGRALLPAALLESALPRVDERRLDAARRPRDRPGQGGCQAEGEQGEDHRSGGWAHGVGWI